MKTSKIYLLGPTESVLTKRGNRFPNMADYLVDHGHEVCYLTTNHYHAEKRHFDSLEIENAIRQLSYEIVVFRTIGYSSNISVRRIIHNFIMSWKMYKWLIERGVGINDILIMPSRPVELIFFIGILKRKRKFKAVMDVQDIWPDALSFIAGVKYAIFRRYCDYYLNIGMKFFDYFLVVAPSFSEWIGRYTDNFESTFVPLGWENARWKAPLKNGNKGEVIKVVCVAKLQLQIDILPFVQAMKEVSGIELTVIGEDGSGDRFNEVQEYIRKYDIQNVQFVAKMGRAELSEELYDHDIGLVPMITTSIPNKVFDYIASGLPQLVLGQNDSSKLVIEERLGWACSFDLDEIILLLRKLNRREIETVQESVLEKRNNYSRNEIFNRLTEIIKQ